MSLTDGMNLEAGATGKDIAQVQRAPLERRLVMAPIGLVAAEVGAQLGIYAENLLAGFFTDSDSDKKKKKKQADESWRTKVLLGKVVLAVMLYPISAPLALGFSASGGIMHWLVGFPTFAESEDQANQRGRQLLKLNERPKGRYTRKLKLKVEDSEDDEDDNETDSREEKEPAQAETGTIDLAAKLTDPDVLHTYGKAAELAFERLIQQGHLPPGTRPVLNDALVQEVQALVRDTQKKAA
jgi:hypothetical protein